MSFIQQFFTSRDNNANAETFVGQEGRLWWDPVTNKIYSSDGETPGGIPLAGGGSGGDPGGSNSQVQFNNSGTFGGSSMLTFDRVTGELTAVSFVGNGSALTNITGANVTGTVANATYATAAGSATTAATVTTNAQPNITSVGNLNSLSVTGNVTANYYIGNGSLLTGISTSYGNTNVSAYLASGTNSANIITSANSRSNNLSVVGNINLGGIITATGNITGGNLLTGANVSAFGNVTGGNIITGGVITTVSNVVANYFVGNGGALYSVTGSNVTGTVANATYAVSAGSATTAATVTTAAQPNITSVGTLTSLTSTGNISGSYFIGNGSLLTGIASSTYGNSNVADYLASGTNSANIVTTGNISGSYFIGNGRTLTGIAGANVTGIVPLANIANYATLAGSALYANEANAVYGSNVVGQVAYAAVANSVAGANVSGAVANATYATTAGTAYSVSGANVSGTVANATYALSANSASSLVNGASIVLLNSDGTMSFPSNIINSNANPITLWSTSSSTLLWRSPTGGGPGQPFQSTVSTNSGNATIALTTGTAGVGSVANWIFNTANVVFPDATVQTTAYPGTATAISLSGNITGGNLLTGGLISAAGNITGGNVIGILVGNLTGTTASLSGNVTAANVIVNTRLFVANGSLSQPSIAFSGDTGADSGFFLIADGNIGITTNAGTRAIVSDTGLSVIGNISGSNISVTGTVTGANINASTLISSAGNVIGANIRTGGVVTATGNITGGNILTGGLISATGNVNSGNILTGGLVTATGNVTGGNVIATTTVYGNAATAFVAGNAAISGVALQMPQEGALRNLNNGLTNMYFDVSVGGSTNGQFQFRSSNAFTNVLTMSPTAFNVNPEAVVTAKTASFGRLPWNSALDTELTIDDYRWRITNSGGIYPQVISNTGGTKNSAWTAVAAISGQAVAQGGSTGVLVANNAWTSLYTFASMNSAGDTVTVTFQDKTLGRIYRITFMRSDNGSTTGYNIIAERLL